MNIEGLKYFSEVAMLKSISKVAEKSHISQPALSNQLLKLESELGVKLLERSNKGVNLTEYGEVVFGFSKEILNLHNGLMKEINNKKNEKKEVKLAVTNVESNVLLSRFCSKIINLFENSNIIIDSNFKENQQGALLSNKFDIIIGKELIRDKDIESSYLGSDKFILVSKKELKIDNIENYTLILYDDEFVTNEFFNMDILNKMNLKTNSLKVIKEYIKQKDTLAFVPKIAIEKELKTGELKEVKNNFYEINYDFFISYKKNLDLEIKEKIKILSEIIIDKLKEDDFM
ncbi:MAG: LysR family transcriptional regulator [Sarcina sp.]